MSRHIKPGTLVKLKTGELRVRRGSPAILLNQEFGGAYRVLCDCGVSLVASWEVSKPKVPIPPFIPARLYLAYGIWTEEDGSKILFSRDYMPMWRISPEGKVTPEDPWRWVKFVDQEWIWDDTQRSPWRYPEVRAKIEQRMDDMGVRGLPRLVDAMDYLIRQEASSIPDAVKLMAPSGAYH